MTARATGKARETHGHRAGRDDVPDGAFALPKRREAPETAAVRVLTVAEREPAFAARKAAAGRDTID